MAAKDKQQAAKQPQQAAEQTAEQTQHEAPNLKANEPETALARPGMRAITPEFREVVREWLPRNADRQGGAHPLAGMGEQEFRGVLDVLDIPSGAELGRVMQAMGVWGEGSKTQLANNHIKRPALVTYDELEALRRYARGIEVDYQQQAEKAGERGDTKARDEYYRKLIDLYDGRAGLYSMADRGEMERAAKGELEQRWLLEAYSALPEQSRAAVRDVLAAMLREPLVRGDERARTLYFTRPGLKSNSLAALLRIIENPDSECATDTYAEYAG